jgi:hypothetical protein
MLKTTVEDETSRLLGEGNQILKRDMAEKMAMLNVRKY